MLSRFGVRARPLWKIYAANSMATTMYPLLAQDSETTSSPPQSKQCCYVRPKSNRSHSAAPIGFAQHVSLLPLSHQLCATSAVVPRPEPVNSPRNSCSVVPGSRTRLVNSTDSLMVSWNGCKLALRRDAGESLGERGEEDPIPGDRCGDCDEEEPVSPVPLAGVLAWQVTPPTVLLLPLLPPASARGREDASRVCMASCCKSGTTLKLRTVPPSISIVIALREPIFGQKYVSNRKRQNQLMRYV